MHPTQLINLSGGFLGASSCRIGSHTLVSSTTQQVDQCRGWVLIILLWVGCSRKPVGSKQPSGSSPPSCCPTALLQAWGHAATTCCRRHQHHHPTTACKGAAAMTRTVTSSSSSRQHACNAERCPHRAPADASGAQLTKSPGRYPVWRQWTLHAPEQTCHMTACQPECLHWTNTQRHRRRSDVKLCWPRVCLHAWWRQADCWTMHIKDINTVSRTHQLPVADRANASQQGRLAVGLP